MKRTVTIAAIVASTLMLTACGKSDAWHVGYCAAGQLNAQGLTSMPSGFVRMAFQMTANKTGMSVSEMEQGFADYTPGSDYSKSCKVAREIDAGRR